MITVREISDHFKVTTRTVYRWIADGAPIKKIGSKHYAESIGSIEEWLQRKKEEVKQIENS